MLTASGSIFTRLCELRLWDTASGRELLTQTFHDLAGDFQFRDNNTRLIATDGMGTDFGVLKVWDGSPRP